ncbi:type II toxin-antitoxin system Phd/YefM family antitoxin [Halorhodospira sp. 9622]|uniref:type II toxin-antitoxin system Phd/YefM family antitoxin n=1 Tax=Halorhodospira sp. 9622 TaxID=2899136 RepID=UPI001EE7AAB1|nr:type II toxin-antitoxin system prevent-host-death family antitoxin [Halorhodospira sp. 9622]MCG5539409.1 type II toxin-antitoxin system prevent-host-death family antitoxin [Halorhodospira sp. 9622]
MKEVNVRQARTNLAQILKEVQQGQEVCILRRGHPIARMTRPEETFDGFRSRADLRQELPPAHEGPAQAIRALRDAERY